ncbi:hypothetical protein RB195_008204 [Necator americanus]|uniref:Uncharacterized protein n=1 Tax=Necator americanus TaxID=51031 RepID=A0ABR1CPG7_NECAM
MYGSNSYVPDGSGPAILNTLSQMLCKGAVVEHTTKSRTEIYQIPSGNVESLVTTFRFFTMNFRVLPTYRKQVPQDMEQCRIDVDSVRALSADRADCSKTTPLDKNASGNNNGNGTYMNVEYSFFHHSSSFAISILFRLAFSSRKVPPEMRPRIKGSDEGNNDETLAVIKTVNNFGYCSTHCESNTCKWKFFLAVLQKSKAFCGENVLN